MARGALLFLLQLRGTVGQHSTTQQAAAPAAADADAERASAAHGVSAPGRRELFFGHGHSPIGGQCTNTCIHANDYDCDDGGPGYEYLGCSLGTDAGGAIAAVVANADTSVLRSGSTVVAFTVIVAIPRFIYGLAICRIKQVA